MGISAGCAEKRKRLSLRLHDLLAFHGKLVRGGALGPIEGEQATDQLACLLRKISDRSQCSWHRLLDQRRAEHFGPEQVLG